MNKDIVQKWKDEIMALESQHFTETMIDFVMRELRYKARVFTEQLPAVVAFDPGVVKSDSVVSEACRDKLRRAVASLENVDASRKDWHPGSDGKVLDLVHPSLFPVVYSHTRILPDSTVDLEDPVASTGLGVVLEEKDVRHLEQKYGKYAVSERFQWLPCEVDIGTDKKPRYQVSPVIYDQLPC